MVTAEGELVERFTEFYRNYYRDDISELAQNYPEQRSLLMTGLIFTTLMQILRMTIW